MSPDELSGRLLESAVRVGRVVDALPNTRLGRHVAGQQLLSVKKMGNLLDQSDRPCRILGQSVATVKRKCSKRR